MTIYERIKSLRIKNNMTQEELALKVGYKSRSTINKIETGLRDVSQKQIVIFAKALNVSPSYLMGWDESEPSSVNRSTNPKGVRIPVLGRVAAGTPLDAIETYDSEEWEEIHPDLRTYTESLNYNLYINYLKYLSYSYLIDYHTSIRFII